MEQNIINNSTIEFCKNLINKKIKIPNSMFVFSGKSFLSISKVAKDVCAIANCGGGNLYYGLIEKSGRIINFSPIENYKNDEEWLYYEIQSFIDQPIKNFKVEFSYIDNNSLIIHLTIPFNNNQPHLFLDGKFYKYENKKTVQMKENEIRRMYGMLNYSDLEIIGITNTNGLPILKEGKFSTISFYPKIFIQNIGNVVEKIYKIEISFPASLYEENFQPLKLIFSRFEGKYAVFCNSGNNPIFQNEINSAIEAKIELNLKNFDDFFTESLIINLYYSKGIKKQELKLSETLTYNGKIITKEDFTS